MKTSLPAGAVEETAARLREASAGFAVRYPGESSQRQPVHTVYGGAHLFRTGSAGRLGELALRSLDQFAPDALTFARAAGLPGAEELQPSPEQDAGILKRLESDPDSLNQTNPAAWQAGKIYRRVREKLRTEPVEDFRIDFEDGYGNRADEEEDGHAVAAAHEVAAGMDSGELPPFIGIRVKPFSEELYPRSVRTLDIFLTALVEATQGKLPGNFVITLPKVVSPEEVAALAALLGQLEPPLKLPAGSLKIELMIETTQALLSEQGVSNLPRLIDAGGGRCLAAHFGTYDYTAGYGITAAHQNMTHPACDFARHMMKVALAGTGIWLSDGATNILPVAPHKPAGEGESLTAEQAEENRRAVHRAWRLHYDHVQHSLANGFYQGWDLHPAQLPTRYAAVYSFFRQGLEPASERLRNFMEKAAQATLVGDIFDDAATGQGLLNFFLRALNCGAITEEEAQATGLSLEELRSRSFLKIMKNRRTSR